MCNKEFCSNSKVITVIIELEINTIHTRFLKNLPKSALWSGPYKMPISVLLIRKT